MKARLPQGYGKQSQQQLMQQVQQMQEKMCIRDRFHAARLSCNDFVRAHCLRHNEHDDGPHQGTGTASA